MRIAFYAPLKPPSHPVPSGDRRIARLLLRALRRAGHEVEVVSTFRSYDGSGSAERQERLRRRGAAICVGLERGRLARWRPDLWFTYHLHHKAPDWLGPRLAEAFRIPYAVAEAAYAPRRSAGRWDVGLAAVAEALRRADVVFLLNPNDAECVLPLVRAPTETLLPFLDTAPYRRARARRAAHRRTLAQRFAIPMRPPWLLAVGMMRPGDKLASFRVLARALRGLAKWPWHLIVIGDGPARGEVRRVLSGLGRRVHWIGALPESALPSFYAASDVLVWPAVNEAIGMAILEAQAAGLPVVAGNAGAIGVIVGDGQTGSLAPVGRAGPFRRALAGLLRQSELRAAMSRRALEKTGQWHGLDRAAEQLDRALQAAVAKVRTGARP